MLLQDVVFFKTTPRTPPFSPLIISINKGIKTRVHGRRKEKAVLIEPLKALIEHCEKGGGGGHKGTDHYSRTSLAFFV